MLQWGRNLIVAEGRPLRLSLLGLRASMGPQLDSCGRLTPELAQLVVAAASMGPQLDSCGRKKYPRAGGGLYRLQWGRNLIVAEGASTRAKRSASLKLQWGRNLIVAEGWRWSAGSAPGASFNGAAT